MEPEKEENLPQDFFQPPNDLNTVLAPVDPKADDGSKWSWERVEAAIKNNEKVPMGAVLRYGKKLRDLTKEERDLIFGATDPFEAAIPEPMDDTVVKDQQDASDEMEFFQDNTSFETKFGNLGPDDEYKVEDDCDLKFLKEHDIVLAGQMQENGAMSRPRIFFEQPKYARKIKADGFADKSTIFRAFSRYDTYFLDELEYPHSPLNNFYVAVYQPPIAGASVHLREFAVLGFTINYENAASLKARIEELQAQGKIWGYTFIGRVGRAVLFPMHDISTEGKIIERDQLAETEVASRKSRKRRDELQYLDNPTLPQIGCNGLNCFIFSYSCPNPHATHQISNCLSLIVHDGFADVTGAKIWLEAKKKTPNEGAFRWPDMFTREMCNGIQLPPPLPSENQGPSVPIETDKVAPDMN